MSDREDPNSASEPRLEPEAPESRIATLEAELAAARDEVRQLHDRWLRERADLENQRKRAARERQDAMRFGNESLIRDLLPVADNLERALQAARGAGNGKSLVDGVELVLKEFLDALQRHGVERVSATGERFDPTRHEAVAHVQSDTHAAGHVIEEHQSGYRLHDRLLRPATVTVSKGKPNLANGEGGD